MLPNDSHVGGAATTFPTQLISGKEYPVGMNADQDGHIIGSLPAFGLMIPPAAVGASKLYFDLFNGSAANILRMRKLFAVVATDVAVTGALGVRLDVFRTSAIGTGGTAATTAASTSTTAPGFWAFNSNNALVSGVTAHTVPTGGATSQQFLFPSFVFTEETNMSSHIAQYYDLLPALPGMQSVECNPGQGMKVVQGTVASVGTIGFLVIFTVE